ncbi:MAG: YXWGXW repeat-containing protein [Gammaproteobacteria bacterium]|nr:YXWGXW repeat-containing protein [Gammaproteobacteria bacterium]
MSQPKSSGILAKLAFAVLIAGAPLFGAAAIGVSITVAPPALPVYEQPPMPRVGLIWTPGYWSYGPEGYFWVPGAWVEPPEVGLLWTPGYWEWSDGVFVWSAGYWAPEVGFYGGVNYGFGYPGHGYVGGHWRGREFYYNSAVNNISNVRVRNLYSQRVENGLSASRVSYLGGPGGVVARPTAQERAVADARHVSPTSAQTRERASASSRRELLASVNHGRPLAGTRVPEGERARGSLHDTSRNAPVTRVPPVHPRDLPGWSLHSPSQSASREEKESARLQGELRTRQDSERSALTQLQERDHARYARQGNGDARAFARMESQHQQQTRELWQRHSEERQRVAQPQRREARAPAPRGTPQERRSTG